MSNSQPANWQMLEIVGEELLDEEGAPQRMVAWFSWREGLCLDVLSSETGNYARMTLTPDQADKVADHLKALATWRRKQP